MRKMEDFGDRLGACDRLCEAEIDAINHRQVKYSSYAEPGLKHPVLVQPTAFNFLGLRQYVDQLGK
jgi:hypothetical protein